MTREELQHLAAETLPAHEAWKRANSPRSPLDWPRELGSSDPIVRTFAAMCGMLGPDDPPLTREEVDTTMVALAKAWPKGAR